MRLAAGLLVLVVMAIGMAELNSARAAQVAASPSPAGASAGTQTTAAGGKLHGVVKSGTTPLPGVSVTAQNTLTGKRYSTTTDLAGVWSLTIPQNGRYVIRTQFAAFAQGSQEALLNETNRDQAVNFQLELASRATAREQQQNDQSAQVAQAVRQIVGNGAQSLSLMSALTGDTETQAGTGGASGAALPSVAGNSDFSEESVAISGQAGAVSPMAGVDIDRLRDAIETFRMQNPGQALPGQGGVMISGGDGGGGIFWAAARAAEEEVAAAVVAGSEALADEAAWGTFATSIRGSRTERSSGRAAIPR